MKPKRLMNADLKLEVTNLPIKTILELIHETTLDQFDLICLSQTIQPTQSFKPLDIPNIKAKYKEQYSEALENVLILNRANIHLSNSKDIKTLSSKQKLEGADLVSIECDDPEVLASALNQYNSNSLLQVPKKQGLYCSDHIFYVNLQKFVIGSSLVRLFTQKGVFVEFGYCDLIAKGDSQATAFVNFFKLMDSQIKNLIVSSGTGKVLFKRSVQEVRDLLVGLIGKSQKRGDSKASLLMSRNPVKLLKMAKLKRMGGVQIVK